MLSVFSRARQKGHTKPRHASAPGHLSQSIGRMPLTQLCGETCNGLSHLGHPRRTLGHGQPRRRSKTNALVTAGPYPQTLMLDQSS